MHGRVRSQVNEAIRLLDEADADLSMLVEVQQRLAVAASGVGELLLQLGDRVGEVAKVAGTIIRAIEEMNEMQMSFNLQYLQLQSQMQNENRQFTMVSNIMKTKHDTVKNSISNIR